MANSAIPTGFVGVPKREPCRKCGNPVFFAERISFEQKLYHRSCLKCARCSAQLTLGSFYETETDGEYCCETCPDEEIQLSQRRRSSAGGGSDSPVSVTNGSRDGGGGGARVNRSSSKLLDRISFFESAPLSDEEKTSNLVKRAKISSFLKDTLDGSGDGLENGHATEVKDTSKLAETIESEDDSSSDEEPPEPPTSAPPELIVSKEPQLAENDAKEDEAALHEVEESPKAEPVAIVREESVQDVPESTVSLNDETEESHTDLEPIRRNSSTSDKIEVEKVNPLVDKEVVNAVDVQVKEQVEEVKPVNVSDESVQEKSAEEVPKAVEKLEEPEISIKEEVPKHDTEVRSDESVAVPTIVATVPEDKPKALEESTKTKELYPTDLNPFGDESDGEHHEASIPSTKPVPSARRVSTNPFGSDDDDEEETSLPVAVKPPRPPPPKLKTAVPANPFDDDDDEPEHEIIPVIVKPSPRRTPVPTPRKQHNHNDSISSMETSLMSSQFGGSSLSLASSMESGPSNATISRRKKSRAPDIPIAAAAALIKASTENLAGSTATTPRKKRLAPAPPTVSSTPKQPESSSPKSTQRLIALDASLINNDEDDIPQTDPAPKPPPTSDDSVVYRRTIVPLKVDDDSLTLDSSTTTPTSERQWEKMKDNKEAQNRNRQSQTSPTSSQNNDSFNSFISNKSQQGKWKRRKGPAPALPVPLPERKAIKMLPLKEIRQEMDIIETQQQGLEKQGVILEQMIRERCEGVVGPEMDITGIQTNSKEVEDLIMQLFELVNEKNELFRRQAELMYLRRQHRLEQEQADLEYEIRLLMAQPERNKTDSDKEKEEALIARLVEIVQMRNEVVDCLEMDRLREAEEDMSIKQSIEERAANQQKHGKKDSDTEKSATGDSTMKLSKKEKKKLKEAKKLVKSKKIDSEKDADDTESSTKEKKKKKKFFADFLHHHK